ncbi:MAG TPA: hypothetical protein EYQ24_14175 [Bacteroidetes bacterium]|nr:hypothetical protein [Bacteroidota bacterium]
MTPRLFAAFCALALLTGCDRPLLDQSPPELEVVSPDPSEVLFTPTAMLRVSADALLGVDRVLISGQDATFDPEDETWVGGVNLSIGANQIPLEAIAMDGTARRDTAVLVFAPLAVTSPAADVLPQPRAGLSATPLPTGQTFIAGGITLGAVVLDTGLLLTEAGGEVTAGPEIALRRRRTGHSATPLANGRVLLLGGIASPNATANAFVAEPEVFDPLAGASRRVVTSGDPILRTGHVALRLDRDGRSYVYVLGGQVPGGNGPTVPETIQIAEFREGADVDTLLTLTPTLGGANGLPFPDPTLFVLDAGAEQVLALTAGVDGNASRADRILFAPRDGRYPYGLTLTSAAAPAEARTAAAGLGLGSGLSLLVGGRSTTGTALASLELYATAADRWLTFPPSVTLGTPRWEHAVTRTPSGRILAIGGRSPTGQPLATLDVLSY